MPVTWRRLSRFLVKAAWELATPALIAKPIILARHFYECFAVATDEDQVALVQEANQLNSAEQIDTLVRDVMAGLAQSEGSTSQIGGELQTITQRLVEGLREAGLAAQRGGNSGEALRRSLNQTMPVGQGATIPAHQLSPEARSIGRLVMSSILAGGFSRADDSAAEARAPLSIPQYKTIRRLGSGGFADVFLMLHEPSGELRAVKFVHTVDDPRRLVRELETLRNVRDTAYLVGYRDDGRVEGAPWIAMEYVGPNSLSDLLKVPAARPTTEQALLLGEQALRGLAALHSRGIIHRDLKPENVMIDDQFRLRLIDFGLAKPFQTAADAATRITKTATIIGSPYYMSLEQLRGRGDITPAVDLWSYGVLLYELLTGSLPYTGDSFVDIALSISSHQINLAQDVIPPEVRPFLGRCLERDVSARYPNATSALQEYMAPVASARRRLRHERYRAKWIPILKAKVLEEFVAQNRGQLPADHITAFIQFAGQKQIQELDELRLAEVLPPISTEHQKVELLLQDMLAKKRHLQQQALSLSPGELQRLSAELVQLENQVGEARNRVTQTVHQLLAEEVKSWDDVRRQEAETEARLQREKEEAARQEKERRRREAEERAERERQEEIRRRREAEERAERKRREEAERREAERRREARRQEEEREREAERAVQAAEARIRAQRRREITAKVFKVIGIGLAGAAAVALAGFIIYWLVVIVFGILGSLFAWIKEHFCCFMVIVFFIMAGIGGAAKKK